MDQVTLLSPQSCMPHHNARMAGGQLDKYQDTPSTEASGRSSH